MKSKELDAPKLVYGVGINDADYVIQKMETIKCIDGKIKYKLIWFCPFYRVWRSMVERCYSDKYQSRQPTYKGCSVSEEWKTFSNFKAWMVTQDWEGKSLDKDLLIEGNKVYGPDTCVFVTRMVNNFTIDSGSKRGDWMIGACWHKGASKFMSKCQNPFSGEQEYLGLFTCEQEAHNAWLKRKLGLAHELAAIQTDTRVAKALIARYTNYKTH